MSDFIEVRCIYLLVFDFCVQRPHMHLPRFILEGATQCIYLSSAPVLDSMNIITGKMSGVFVSTYTCEAVVRI